MSQRFLCLHNIYTILSNFENMNSIYCKKQKENGTTFLLKMVNMHDHLAFLILEESAAYLGKATNNYLKETAAYFSVDSTTYCSDLEKHIKGTASDIKISLTDDRFSVNRIVGKMNVTYFSVNLEQMDFGAMAMKIATELLSLYKDANTKSAETNDKLLQAQSSRDNYKNKLEQYAKEHNNFESQLYSSFLLVLNEKKRQLQFHKDFLDKSQVNQISKSPTRIALSDDENSEENSDFNQEAKTANSEDYNTDEENNTNNGGHKRVCSNSFDSNGEPLPGPSKTKNWAKTKSADFVQKSLKSVSTKTDLRSKSDRNFDSPKATDFDLNFEDFDKDFNIDTDISPPPKLPKRIKSDKPNVAAVIKTSSEAVQSQLKQESPEITEDSPTLNFTTQDLFDRM